jgi:hypothetical protein
VLLCGSLWAQINRSFTSPPGVLALNISKHHVEYFAPAMGHFIFIAESNPSKRPNPRS